MQELELDLDMAAYQPPSDQIDYYREHGFQGNDATAAEMLADASLFSGAAEQGWKFRLLQGQILTKWKERTPGFFEKWLQLHWPHMGRATVARLMATWEHRSQLGPFVDEDGDFSRGRNALPIKAVDAIASGGAMPEVIEQVRERLEQGMVVTPQVVADLNRESKAKRKGVSVPRKLQPAECRALSILRKGEADQVRETEQMRQVLDLIEKASMVTADQVMKEVSLRDLSKFKFIPGQAADFHRMKDGSWIRLPHAGDVDVTPGAAVDVEPEQLPEPVEPVNDRPPWDAAPLLSMVVAAERLGIAKTFLNAQLTPAFAAKRNGAPLIRNGFKITREGRGMVRLTPVAEPA
jgi:hypothetical protein